MRGKLLTLVLVTFGLVRPAAAFDTCRDMLMPVGQIKQVSRGLSRYHSGVDLMAPLGTPVRAADAGIVIFAGRFFGYGNIVDLRHQDGLVTRYAHLSAFAPQVHPGVLVAAGEQIGAVGATGHAHGPHLHFEVREHGRAIDPKPFIHLANCIRPAPGPEMLEEARAPAPAVAAPTLTAQIRPGGQ
jgi:hypothetical protein